MTDEIYLSCGHDPRDYDASMPSGPLGDEPDWHEIDHYLVKSWAVIACGLVAFWIAAAAVLVAVL